MMDTTEAQRAQVLAAMTRIRAYFPWRKVWATVKPDGSVQAFANATWAQRNAAVRNGERVYTFATE